MENVVLQERITLQVRMEDPTEVATEEGFRSSDDCECVMAELFKVFGLPYVTSFTCATIKLEKQRKQGPFANRPGIRKPTAEAAYGENIFVLNDGAVSEITIVCAGDFQNVACEIVADILNARKSVEQAKQELNKSFRVIHEGASASDMEQHLRWAVGNKGSRPYAEARLLRPVWTKDGEFA